MIVRTLVRSIMLVTLLVALLVGSNAIPDPCVTNGDDCCSAQSSETTCNTACCVGMLATPVVVFRLDVPVSSRLMFERHVASPEFAPPAPLIRPPIAA